MATGGRRKQPHSGQKDLQNDDPSILSYSSSYPGNNQRHIQPTSTLKGSQSTGQRHHKQNDQTFHGRTNGNRNEQWKVDKNGELARDLFEAELNPWDKFDGQNKKSYQNEVPQNRSHRVNIVPAVQKRGGNPSNVGPHQRGYKNSGRPETHDLNDVGKSEYPRNYRNNGRGPAHPDINRVHPKVPETSEPNQMGNSTKADHRPRSYRNNGKEGSHPHHIPSYPGREETTPHDNKGMNKKNVQFLQTLMGKNGKSEMKITVDSKTNGRKVDVNRMLSQNDRNDMEQSSVPVEKMQTGDQVMSAPAPSSGKDQIPVARIPIASNPNTSELTGVEIGKRKKKRVRKRNRKNKYERESQTSSLTEDVEEDQGASHEAEVQKENNIATSSGVTDYETSTSASSKCNEETINVDPVQLPKAEQKEEEHPPASAEDTILQDAENKNSAPSSEEVGARKREELEMGLKQAELRLEKDQIFKLEKISPTFPEAIYFCQLCSHHLNTVAHAHRHIKDKRHKKEFKTKQQDELLQKLKPPPEEAINALEQLLQTVIREKMMSPDDARERKEVVKRLHKVIKEKLPDCSVALYGSSVTMISLKTSDINIELQFPDSMKTPTVLLSLLEILKNSEDFKDINEDFEAKVPRIEITDKLSNLRCSLSANNVKALHTTRLLKIYGMIEPAVVKLSSLFRLWGKLCMVDQQTKGSLPPHSFALMTIFFLQKKHGLAVLHEIMLDHDIEALLCSEAENCKQLELRDDGSWWYCPTSPPGDKNKEKAGSREDEEDELEDPGEYSDSDLEIVFGESPQKKSYVDQLDSSTGGTSPSKPIKTSLEPVKIPMCFDGSSQRLSDLWLEMLKFFSVQFDMENLVISIRYSTRVTRSDRGWSHRRIAIEDPCSPKWNLCKPMNSQVLFSYFMMRLKHSVFYFHTAHNSARNNAKKVEPTTQTYANSDLPSRLSQGIVNAALTELKYRLQGREDHIASSSGSSLTAASKEEKPLNYLLCYKFSRASLTEGNTPVTVCCICKHEGHSKKNCPDEVTVKVHPLPPLTERLKKILEEVCKEMFETYMPREDEIAMRDHVCNKLLDYLKRNYDSKVEICLFGSSRNGFTFRGSDLDICMTFDGNLTGEGLDFVQIIEDLAKVLRRDNALRQIIPITTAKVPIVKFYHPSTQLEGDISLYNLLAQRNTKMLSLYSNIDERCRILGYAMKAFVKRCCIGDASRGSLSSYAYTLLVLYYLQQRNPPVIPVLQELYEGEKCPEVIVDEWNSWFFHDLDKLGQVWDGYKKNKETLGVLWLGMLRFYTEDFNFKKHVISIRQKKILTAFEKEWTSKCICIEDPFDLNHNLGAGVSRKMTNFIMKVFVKAREHFGTEPNANLNGFKNYQDYFFNAKVLMDGQEVPNDRCCRICGKIGHFVKDCPKKRNGRKKNGDTAKMKEVECFGCGRQGHFKKDCPEYNKGQQFIGSPTKSPGNPGMFGSPLNYPLHVGNLPSHNPFLHLGASPLMHNRGHGAPNIVYAKRNNQHNPSLFEQSNNRQDANNSSNGKKGGKQTKQKNNGNQRQQQTTSRSNDHNPSPYPSSGENTRNRKSSDSSKVGRNLFNEFDKSTHAGQKPVTNTNDAAVAPRGSVPTETASKKAESSNVKSQMSQMMSLMSIKPQNSPSNPIEGRGQRPGRQYSETDIPQSPTGNFHPFPNFPYPVNNQAYPYSPHSPTKHYHMGSSYFQPHISTSPRQYPMPPSPTDGCFYRSPSSGPITPPGSMPPQLRGPSGPSSRINYNSPQGPHPIPGAVFVNSHYSYPPNQSHPPAPNEPQYHSSPRY